MKCEKIQELILSDYTDGELNEGLKKRVRNHLTECAQCRELEERLQNMVITPLRDVPETQSPEMVWERIKSAIEVVPETWTFRIPVFAVAAVATAVLIMGIFAGVYLKNRIVLGRYIGEQVAFLDSLGNGNSGNGVCRDIGIPLEDFFL